MGDVAQWLDDLGLGQYAEVFAENAIDWEVLPDLADHDLETLGVLLGHRKKLLKAISGLASEASARGAAPGGETVAHEGPIATTEAERRQLTVLFCDMVGSTALSGRLDPEDMRKLIGAYQNTVAGEIGRFEGHVAKFMGDGLLAYFGYPRAHEDDAERAVRAGLAVTEAVRSLTTPTGEAVAVRVGIATGLVVVGDLIGKDASEQDSVVGQTPNLAARLQGLAEPNTVVVAPETRRIVGDLFDYQDLGHQTLKGFAEPIHLYRVLGVSETETRFEARFGGHLTPLVGREEESQLLLRRWRRAEAGEGQVVLVSGEPGIGKSRIVQVLRQRIGDEPSLHIRYQCSPYFTQSALYPFVEQLRLAAGFTRDDEPKRKLDKLEAMLRLATDDVGKIVPLFAALLSVPTGERYPGLDLAPEQWKERTFEALLHQMEQLAKHAPMLVVFEDAHWIDPTSLELLDRTVERADASRILLIITFRPGFAPPWVRQSNVSLLSLNRMGRRECAAMVEKVTGGKALPDEVLDQIVTKTDGVPLFVEELTKTVLESGLLEEQPDRYVLSGPLPPLAIPTSLQDSLMARLDRMAPVKEVAQMAAAIGREFSYDLLAAVGSSSEANLRDALARLTSAELVFQHGMPPNARYSFKHALVRDAAYQSLLKSRRLQLHRRIADALETRFPEVAASEPEIVAHHLTEAGLTERAIAYWQRAGERAAERFANAEAIAKLTKGLELIQTLPQTPERASRELALQLMLGPALITVRTPASVAVERTFAAARCLAEQVGDTVQKFTALWGLWQVYEHRAQWSVARQHADELMDLAYGQEDVGLRLQAHHAEWSSAFFYGDLRAAREHSERGSSLYDRSEHGRHALRYGGHDPGACASSINALSLALLGLTGRAVESLDEALVRAGRLDHPATMAQTNVLAAFLYQCLGDEVGARRYAEASLAVGAEHGVAAVYLMARILEGWATAEQGPADKTFMQLSDLLRPLRNKKRPMMMMPYYLGLFAEVCLKAGRAEEGLEALGEGFDMVEDLQERLWEAELLRLKGEILLSRSPEREDEAEQCFSRAIEVARDQGAMTLELRSALALARVWQRRRSPQEACEVLAPIYGRFTEGFVTRDLKDAKQILGLDEV